MQKPSFRRSAAIALVAASVTLLPSVAAANERHFTYTYESATLRPGQLELEPWTTFRAGRDDFYTRLDQRLEFEAGIVDRLQTSLYWNFSSVTQDVPIRDATGVTRDERQSEFEMESISNEWKYQLTDPVADALGLALYLEWALGTSEAEIEAKVILDKRLGNLLLAANVVGEHEWEFDTANELSRELILEADLAAGYFLSESFLVGLEVRNHTDFENADEFEHSAFFAGPVVSYSSQNWWAALTILPQLGAIKGDQTPEAPAPGAQPVPVESGALTFQEHERFEVRLLAGLQFR